MSPSETLRGRLRTPKEVELEKELNLPVGSEVSISIAPAMPSTTRSATFMRFKSAAGSWKDIPKDFIKRVYADRHISNRRDVIL